MPFLFDYSSWDDWRGWLDDHALRLLLVAAFLVVLEAAFRRVISRILSGAITRAARVRHEENVAIRRRADTLSATLNWAFGVLLGFLGLGLVLSELGLNVSALIAGVGVVGIALGLGAQTLVKDVINGLFILIEDQYAVGDVVTVAGSTGTVVEINPRRTVIRDDAGNLHTIPNSAITIAVNRTGGLNRFTVSFATPFEKSDAAAKAATDVAKEVGSQLSAELLHPPVITDQSMDGNGEVRFVLMGDARRETRWMVEAELRRRLQSRFEADQLEVSFENGEQVAAKT